LTQCLEKKRKKKKALNKSNAGVSKDLSGLRSEPSS
jgi:hypothetical protein